ARARRATDHDFGRSIIPELVPTGRVYAYDFQSNEVPGVKPYEEHGYWRDVGTVQAYWDAHMDLLGESPRFDLDNRWWPIRTGQHPGPPARFIGGEVDNVHVGEASLIKRATIRNSILGRSARHRHPRTLLPAAAREPLAGGGGSAGFGRAVPRLERAHHRRVLRAEHRRPPGRRLQPHPGHRQQLRGYLVRRRPHALRVAGPPG